MSDRIILVSYPDDIFLSGIRILLFDLKKEQTDIVSRALTDLEFDFNLIVYSVNFRDDTKYMIDKYLKSQIVIFNSESENQTIIGFLASKTNSMYFGNLRSLSAINDSIIYGLENCKDKLERMIIKYGKF